MNTDQRLKVLEGLGYTAALMIGVGGIFQSKVLYFFNVFGLVFAVIAIVRLMVMQIRMNMRPEELFSTAVDDEIELPELDSFGVLDTAQRDDRHHDHQYQA
jgi:hypothetical protein